MALSVTQRRVRERCTAKYTATIEDESGTALAAASLTTLTLTLYDRETGTIINSRSAQNVLNANNVTVSAAGVMVWSMQPADNAIVGSPAAGQPEIHIALFEWTWASGAKAGKYEVQIDVTQLTKVPAS